MGLIQLCNALYAVSPDLWYQIAAASFTPELSTDWGGQQRLLACSGVPRGGGRCPDL